MDEKKEKIVPIAPATTVASCGILNRKSSHVTVASTPALEQGLRKYDVLTGRGSGPNQNEGNTAFRQLVFETYQIYYQYLNSPHRAEREQQELTSLGESVRCRMNGTVKNLLAGQILAQVRERNGRFLRRICKEDYRNMKPEDKARLVRVLFSPRTGEQEKSHSQQQDDEGVNAPSCANASSTVREILYVELSSKATIEKIKQSLRFQVDRMDQKEKLLLQQSHPSSIQRNSRKRSAIDHSLLRSISGESAAAGFGIGSPERPAKKLCASMGVLKMNSIKPQFGTSTAASSSFTPTPFGLDAAIKVFARHRSFKGPTFNNESIDFSSGPSLRPLMDGMNKAATSVDDCLHLRQQEKGKQENKNLTTFEATVNALKERSGPYSHLPTMSSFRSTTQLEALLQLLYQQKRETALSAFLRDHQDLKMAFSVPERLHPTLYQALAQSVGVTLRTPSAMASRFLLQSNLERGNCYHRLSTPSRLEPTRTLPCFVDRRLSLMCGTDLPSRVPKKVLERLHLKQAPVNPTTASLIPSDRVRTHGASHDLMPLSFKPVSDFCLAALKKSQGDDYKGE